MTGPYFLARSIDNDPQLLERSYRLRYQVYCRERQFLRAEDYPEEMETDAFDRHAVHVGAIDPQGELAGTARVVRASELGLPLFAHCTIFPDQTEFHPDNDRLVEVGRLAVSRSYRRRRSDGAADASGAGRPLRSAHYRGIERRHGSDEVFLVVLKALYQASRRIGATHWLAATEKPLQRMLSRQGFPFRVIGPESDYLGMVAPYQMNLDEFEAIIRSGQYPALDDFIDVAAEHTTDTGDDDTGLDHRSSLVTGSPMGRL